MRLAFSGHIDIEPQDLMRLKVLLFDKLKELHSNSPISHILVGDAEGADALIREVCNEMGLVLLPLNEAVSELSDEDSTSYFIRQGKYLLSHSDQLIVLWDGIFTGKQGGTGWVVAQALQGDTVEVIHHLVCPRKSNPFPVSSLNAMGLKSQSNDLPSQLPWVPAFHWVSLIVDASLKKKISFSSSFTWRLPFAHNLWQSFIIPGIFALTTLLLGWWGFSLSIPKELTNNFYRAINLIILNDVLLGGTESNILLQIARFTGLLTPLSALSFGLYAATKSLRIKQTLRNWMRTPSDFSIIVGHNEEGLDLAKDLSLNQGQKVLIVDLNDTDQQLRHLTNAILLKGVQGMVHEFMKEQWFQGSGTIYFIDKDEENLRLAMQLDVIQQQMNDASRMVVYVRYRDDNNARFLHDALSFSARLSYQYFSLEENTVRRLFLHYPVDRLTEDSKQLSIHILGDNGLVGALKKQVRSQAHIGKKLKIEMVHYSSSIDKNPMESSELPLKENVEQYVWEQWNESILNFSTDIEMDRDVVSSLEKSLKTSGPVSLYVCLDDGIQSAIWLTRLMPRLDQLKAETKGDLQVYCYYNYPDKTEEERIEQLMNRLAPHTLVKCFGNLLDECTFEALHNDRLDDIARQISAWYYGDNSRENALARDLWAKSSFKDKRSNRQAADHLWWKWRRSLELLEEEKSTLQCALDELSELSGKKWETLSEMEHRRWCADLLLQGFKTLPQKYLRSWMEKKENKKIFQSQYLHKDLLPFDALSQEDQEKDADQIKRISEFVRATYLT